jgi:hypothetical protein
MTMAAVSATISRLVTWPDYYRRQRATAIALKMASKELQVVFSSLNNAGATSLSPSFNKMCDMGTLLATADYHAQPLTGLSDLRIHAFTLHFNPLQN